MSLLDGMSTEQAFTRLMRCFCTRLAQCVVQSRMVCEARQPCVPVVDNRTWFNMVVDEIGEIAAHLKLKMENYSPRKHPFTLEFTLHTADGDYLPVEIWVVWLDLDHVDENMNLHKIFYPQLSTLLKSVMMASRFTPIYRHYANRQDADSFVLLYKVSIDHPDVSVLGDDPRHRQLGNLPTPFGAVRMDLYYRTRMEILPSEIPVDTGDAAEKIAGSIPTNESGVMENSQVINLYGNAIPAKGSDVIASSPAFENVNRFSASPLNDQDFPLADSLDDVEKASFNLGLSTTTATTDDGPTGTCVSTRHPSGGSAKSESNVSPSAKSSSFPQRAACRQTRIRNNSFPFYSLLVMDLHGSSDQFRSQILPKVPEDVAVTSGGLHTSSSDRALCDINRDINKNQRKKRHSSLTGDVAEIREGSLFHEETRNNTYHVRRGSQESSCDEKNFCNKRRVVFGCSLEEEDSVIDAKLAEHQSSQQSLNRFDKVAVGEKIDGEGHSKEDRKNGDDDQEDDRHSCSSDDSYVKVVPFANDDSLYSDLTDFAQEVHVAPRDLASSFQESASELSKQIDEFREKAVAFDDFVASLKYLDENSSGSSGQFGKLRPDAVI